MDDEQIIDLLYQTLKESYPDCKDAVRTQLSLIKDGKKPTNMIGMLIEDNAKKLLKRREVLEP